MLRVLLQNLARSSRGNEVMKTPVYGDIRGGLRLFCSKCGGGSPVGTGSHLALMVLYSWPLGHMQRKEPSMFTHWASPHTLLSRSHSFTSVERSRRLLVRIKAASYFLRETLFQSVSTQRSVSELEIHH